MVFVFRNSASTALKECYHPLIDKGKYFRKNIKVGKEPEIV